MVAGVLEGYNGSIACYGQTGTGKTHTMGILKKVTSDRAGLIPRALSHVFGHAAATSGRYRWRVTMSFVQIYCERVQDLFRFPDQGGGRGGLSKQAEWVGGGAVSGSGSRGGFAAGGTPRGGGRRDGGG